MKALKTLLSATIALGSLSLVSACGTLVGAAVGGVAGAVAGTIIDPP